MPKFSTAVKSTTGPPLLPPAPVSDLQKIRIFRDIPKQALLLLNGKVRRARVEADETILELAKDDQFFRYFFFITRGQVKVVGFDEEARGRSLNFLRKGEFFVDKALSWGSQIATKVVAITDAELLILPREELRALATQFRPFHDKLRTLTDRVDYRNRIYSEDKYARSVLEFLIETELTQASRVKITQMDKCIECNICYKECEERHGFQRLERGYAHFGTLDFAQSCLTCFYPTCIPSCPVDSVIFNTQKGEVEILDSCIGCSACARACQYGAIKMYKVKPEDPRFERFLAPDKKIEPKFVADKCNHCYGYADMACITNCPTGAIIEIEATELLENPRIFGAGEGKKRQLPSRIKRGFLDLALQKLYVVLLVLGSLWLGWEALALSKFASGSTLLALQKAGHLPAEYPFEFGRGTKFCNLLGIIGFSLIMLGMLYPLRKAFPRPFKHLGKLPAWLDLHNFCGLMGTGLVFLHAGMSFPFQPSTFGFFFLLAVTISGVFGRFLYHVIPRGVAGTELQITDIEDEDAALSKKLDALVDDSSELKAFLDKIVKDLTADAVKDPTLWKLMKSVVRTHFLLIQVRRQLPKQIQIHGRQIGVFMELLHEKIRLRRNVAFLSMSSRLFIQWQWVHRPAAYLMVLIVIGHIIKNIFFFPNL